MHNNIHQNIFECIKSIVHFHFVLIHVFNNYKKKWKMITICVPIAYIDYYSSILICLSLENPSTFQMIAVLCTLCKI
jgi:hypothetical protein